jgi:hypothetical protein
VIDFNNDALDKIADTLTPLIGSEVRVYGCFEDGGDYTFGTLRGVHATDGGAIIEVSVPFGGGIKRLHAFQEAHRILIDD